MGKSFFGETEEQRGSLPALTGALMEVVSIERGKTGEQAKTPGLRRYTIELKVVEPKEFAGSIVRDYITVGTVEDPLAKRPETWSRSEAGPGRLKRFLTRSGTPLSDDDEEWMEAAEGRQVIAPVSARPADDGGRVFNSPGLYFRPSDEDAPEIGEATGAPAGGKGKAKGAAQAAKKARAGKGEAKGEEGEEEDEKPAKSKKAAPKEVEEEEEEEEEKPKKSSKKSKKDDDEDEEDDD